jgi:hypothetical protein
MEHVEAFVRILAGVLFHPGHQRLRAGGKEWILVPEAGPGMLRVRFANTAGSGELQKETAESFLVLIASHA